MDTHLMIGIAVMMGLIGIAASRDLLRMRRAQLQPVALRSRPSRADTAARRAGRSGALMTAAARSPFRFPPPGSS